MSDLNIKFFVQNPLISQKLKQVWTPLNNSTEAHYSIFWYIQIIYTFSTYMIGHNAFFRPLRFYNLPDAIQYRGKGLPIFNSILGQIPLMVSTKAQLTWHDRFAMPLFLPSCCFLFCCFSVRPGLCTPWTILLGKG